MLAMVRMRYPDVLTRQFDLFHDEFGTTYDVVTVFRLLRHYEYGDRRKLWAKLRSALTPDGVLLFDAPNMHFELPNRQKNGWGKFPLYDTFWTRRSIEKELRDNGLQLAAVIPVGAGLYPVSPELIAEPMTFTVMARKL
jgi:SAM-dependent methyltransferase